MDLTQVPFCKHLGIQQSSREGGILELSLSPDMVNHLGTFHAGAIFTLAEACSGEFLIRHRGEREDIGGVVRRTSGKYSSPGTSDLFGKSDLDPAAVKEAIETVDQKGRSLITIPISIFDQSETLIGKFTFDWLLASTGSE